MKTLEQVLVLVTAVSLASLQPSSAQTCEGLFRCNDSTSFHLCSFSSSAPYACEGGTFCGADCAFPCVATPHCAPRCNAAGFYCTSLNQSQLCVDDDSPSGDVITCSNSLICSMNCDVQCSPDDCRPANAPPDNNNITLPCQDVGIFPDVNNVTNFYLCSRLSTAVLHATLYTCPEDYIFDPDEACVHIGVTDETTMASLSCGPSEFHCLTLTEFSVCVDGGPPEGRWTCPQYTFCHEDNEQPCSESIPTTTTLPPFVCEREGKFSDPVNCSLYHLCARKVSGGFHQSVFFCPVASFFNVMTEQCSRDPKVCSFTTTPPPTSTSTTTDAAPFFCTEAGRYPDPDSCEHYYDCTRRWFSEGFKQSHRKCLLWTMFDSVRRKCVCRSTAVCAAA